MNYLTLTGDLLRISEPKLKSQQAELVIERRKSYLDKSDHRLLAAASLEDEELNEGENGREYDHPFLITFKVVGDSPSYVQKLGSTVRFPVHPGDWTVLNNGDIIYLLENEFGYVVIYQLERIQAKISKFTQAIVSLRSRLRSTKVR